MWNRVAIVAGCVGASSLVAYAFYHFRTSENKLSVREHIGVVTSLVIYPVKSCSGIKVTEARCTEHGLASSDYRIRDRQFMLADSDGAFISSRIHPSLVNVKPRLEGHTLILEAPGMEKPLKINLKNAAVRTENIVPCRVFNQNFLAIECDTECHCWFSTFVKSEVRLLYFNPELHTRQVEDLKEGYHNRLHRPTHFNAQSMFSDGFPYLAVNEQSCEDLNTHLDSSSQITYRTFRPNILMSTNGPWVEDSWRDVSIGRQKFFHEKPCGRCRNVNVNPETAEVHPKAEPLNTLRKLRQLKDYKIKSPSFGINLVIEGESHLIKVGDPVIA